MAPTAARVSLEAFTGVARKALTALDALVAPRGQAWVVGGAPRDALLGRPAGDLDIAVAAGAIELGRALADRLAEPFVVLDERRGVCRVAGAAQIDLADFRAPDLAGDLRGRDFTVNALALPIHDLVGLGGAGIEDATSGLADLGARRVRLCAPSALADDPVRVLRAARLAAAPGWTLAPDVEPAARAAAPALAAAAAERVREELVALLAQAAAGRGFRLLDRFGAFEAVLPESVPMRRTLQPEPHRFDVWEHSLRAVEAVDVIAAGLDRLEPWADDLRAHLAEGLGDGMTRAEALKLGALLHDVAKPETRAEVDGRIRFFGHDHRGAERAREIAGRLRLTNRATGVLVRLVDQHLRPMHLAQSGGITRRARYRFFRDLGDEARDLLLLALADAAAVRGDAPEEIWAGEGGAVLRSLMAGRGEIEQAAAAPPLLRGEDVMRALALEPGPAVGQALARIREAQAIGLVSTRAEALAHLRQVAGLAGPSLDSADEGPIE